MIYPTFLLFLFGTLVFFFHLSILPGGRWPYALGKEQAGLEVEKLGFPPRPCPKWLWGLGQAPEVS